MINNRFWWMDDQIRTAYPYVNENRSLVYQFLLSTYDSEMALIFNLFLRKRKPFIQWSFLQ